MCMITCFFFFFFFPIASSLTCSPRARESEIQPDMRHTCPPSRHFGTHIFPPRCTADSPSLAEREGKLSEKAARERERKRKKKPRGHRVQEREEGTRVKETSAYWQRGEDKKKKHPRMIFARQSSSQWGSFNLMKGKKYNNGVDITETEARWSRRNCLSMRWILKAPQTLRKHTADVLSYYYLFVCPFLLLVIC